MNRTITLVVDEAFEKSLERECAITGSSRDEYVQNVMNKHFLKEAFLRLREITAPLGAAAGYITDEDVFRDIS